MPGPEERGTLPKPRSKVWYSVIPIRERHACPSGSLYLVTGHDKATLLWFDVLSSGSQDA